MWVVIKAYNDKKQNNTNIANNPLEIAMGSSWLVAPAWPPALYVGRPEDALDPVHYFYTAFVFSIG